MHEMFYGIFNAIADVVFGALDPFVDSLTEIPLIR